MTTRRSYAATLAVVMLVAACNAILGNEEITYVVDAGAGGADSGGVDGEDVTPRDASPDADAAVDAPFRTELTREIAEPWHLAVASEDVVVTALDGVYRVPKLGVDGPPAKIGTRPTLGVAMQGSTVYYCDGNAGNGGLFRVSIDGGSSDSLAPACLDVATTPTHVVFSMWNGGIAELASDGGGPVVLFTSTGPYGVETDDVAAYFADTSEGIVAKIPFGGSPTTLADGGDPRRLAIDATYVYFAQFGSPVIKRVAKDGIGGAQDISQGPSSVGYGGIAVDETHVYWIVNASSNGGLFRAPLGGGIAEPIRAVENAIDVALDADYAYVTAQKPGRVLRIPKK